MPRSYYVYILSSASRNVYIGVTRDVVRRLIEHRAGMGTFTARYRIQRLVHVEVTTDVRAAIAREKELKEWTRERKCALIRAGNPRWDDLAPGGPAPCTPRDG